MVNVALCSTVRLGHTQLRALGLSPFLSQPVLSSLHRAVLLGQASRACVGGNGVSKPWPALALTVVLRKTCCQGCASPHSGSHPVLHPALGRSSSVP